MVFVLLLGYSLFRGVKNKQAGAAGGILALMVFSLGSYPLQLPEFWVVLVVLIGVIESSSVAIDTPPTLSPAGEEDTFSRRNRGDGDMLRMAFLAAERLLPRV